jgi:hypothetical protein
MYIDQVNIFGQEKQEQGMENLEERFDLHEFIYNESGDVVKGFNVRDYLYGDGEEMSVEGEEIEGDQIENGENEEAIEGNENANLISDDLPQRSSQGGMMI